MQRINLLLLKKHHKFFNYKKSDEYKFYKKYKSKANVIKYSYKVESNLKQFDIICKNIIVSSILNKINIDKIYTDLFNSVYLNSKLNFDEFLAYYHDRIVDLKSFKSNNIDIYIPIFSHTLNDIYYNDPLELLKEPYQSILKKYDTNFIDLFSTYNFEVFDSNFTKLIKIKDYGDIVAFYDFDFGILFFVNSQGRLDYYLPIFDKYLDKINTSHLIQKISVICDDYYDNNVDRLIIDLKSNNFISIKMYNYLLKKLKLKNE